MNDHEDRLTSSVALCTYNGASYIAEQLQSIFVQTRPPQEIIVSDDGSTDDTLSIVASLKSSSPCPIHVFTRPKSLGPTQNFAFALSQCQGDVVLFSDQDDVWMLDHLASLVAPMEQDPDVMVVISDAFMVDENLEHLNHTLWDSLQFEKGDREAFEQGEWERWLMQKTIAFGATMAYRHSVLGPMILPIPPHWGHDNWTSLIGRSQGVVKALDKPLLMYRQHQKQVTGAEARRSAMDRLRHTPLTGVLALITPNANSYHVLAQRLVELNAKHPLHPEGQQLLELARQKSAHMAFREAFLRTPLSLSQLLSWSMQCARGNYARFSNGTKSSLKDLLAALIHTLSPVQN